MPTQIINSFTGEVQYECSLGSKYDTEPAGVRLGEAVKRALSDGVKLNGTTLSGANLAGANLTGADLTEADLAGANLAYATLNAVCFTFANLNYASLQGADLMGALFVRACLKNANLSNANLAHASFSHAYLRRTDFRNANLTNADFTNAIPGEAIFEGALGLDMVIARTRILPEGDLIGWKKVHTPNGGKAVIKLRIPADARRSNSFRRMCRAEFVDVLEAPEGAYTCWNGLITSYVAGERVYCHRWDDDWQVEGAGGIHFFITRKEAEAG